MILICPLLSCKKLSPAGFWTDYQEEFLKQNLSDQGPWGGTRTLYWQSEIPQTFRSYDIIQFALKNGWSLKDSLYIDTQRLNTWALSGSPIFPLSFSGFNATGNDNFYSHFPRWIRSASKVYSFKTGWVTYEPGTDKVNNINGFVLLSVDGKQLSVYHLWGD
jgi:hypothetical protein